MKVSLTRPLICWPGGTAVGVMVGPGVSVGAGVGVLVGGTVGVLVGSGEAVAVGEGTVVAVGRETVGKTAVGRSVGRAAAAGSVRDAQPLRARSWETAVSKTIKPDRSIDGRRLAGFIGDCYEEGPSVAVTVWKMAFRTIRAVKSLTGYPFSKTPGSV